MPKRIHVDSDFTIVYTFRDRAGALAAIPDCPFTVTLGTVGRYFAGWDGAHWRNCVPLDANRIRIIVARHALGCGVLRMQLCLHRPDADFPDGVRYLTDLLNSEIELWEGPNDDDTLAVEVAALLSSLYKGDKGDQGEKGEKGNSGAPGTPFTFNDLTPAQRQILADSISESKLSVYLKTSDLVAVTSAEIDALLTA